MFKIFPVIASLTLGAVALATSAAAEPLNGVWDMSAQELKVAYPAAIDQPGRHGQVVEMRDVTVLGVRWSRVEFRYDENQHLTRLRLFTTERSYEQLEGQMSSAADPLWNLGSDDLGHAPARQAMLCDYGADGVVLSFDEPAAVALPKTITASLDAPGALR